MEALQAANAYEVELLGVMKGSRSTENSLHRRFAKYRCVGGKEWYFPHAELKDYIKKNSQVF